MTFLQRIISNCSKTRKTHTNISLSTPIFRKYHWKSPSSSSQAWQNRWNLSTSREFSTTSRINKKVLQEQTLSSKARLDPDPDTNDDESIEPLQLNPDLIHHLERTSLVDFDNVAGLHRLEEAIKFADQILEVDTTGVEPMSTVLEEIILHLREDHAVKTSRESILSNASITDEDYFVSPPGNIPLEADVNKSYIKTNKQKL